MKRAYIVPIGYLLGGVVEVTAADAKDAVRIVWAHGTYTSDTPHSPCKVKVKSTGEIVTVIWDDNGTRCVWTPQQENR